MTNLYGDGLYGAGLFAVANVLPLTPGHPGGGVGNGHPHGGTGQGHPGELRFNPGDPNKE